MLTLFLGTHPMSMVFHLHRDFTKNHINKRPGEKSKGRQKMHFMLRYKSVQFIDDVAREIIVY